MFISDIISIFLIAIGLSAGCFAVALGGGISNKNQSWLQVLRLSLSFGIFQALMTVLGWVAGRTVVDLIADYDHWVVFVLLAAVSGKMFWEAFNSDHAQKNEVDITRGFVLMVLSIATSIDALAVGLSFAFLKVNIAHSIFRENVNFVDYK